MLLGRGLNGQGLVLKSIAGNPVPESEVRSAAQDKLYMTVDRCSCRGKAFDLETAVYRYHEVP